MDYRKLIKFGSSSYVISLPGYWLKRNKLDKGDIIYLEEDGNSRLVLRSGEDKKEAESELSIDTSKKDFQRVKGEIYNAYIDGYDIIKLAGNNIDSMSDDVRRIINNFVAMEIIEQTNDKIVAKNFLNINDVKISDVIRRIDIILRSMIQDSLECIDGKSCNTIINRDLDVNRLCFMLERILRAAMNNPQVSRQIGLSGTNLLHSWYIIMNLERIGDEVKRISRFLNSINFNTRQRNQLRKIYAEIEIAYLDVMKAYYKNDRELAFDVNFRKEKLHEKCNLFYEKNHLPKLSAMTEKMKALVAWIRTIALFVYTTRFG